MNAFFLKDLTCFYALKTEKKVAKVTTVPCRHRR
jgi:hypothetical protein